MLGVRDLLSLAVYLSILNYYLGLVLLASPLPLQLKRFGARMAYHGVVSALLASLYTSIVYAVELLLASLGASWSSLSNFYSEASGYAAMFYAFAASLLGLRSMLLREVPKQVRDLLGFAVKSVASNLLRASTLIAVSEAVVKVLASFVLLYWPLLLLLGIVAYSMPGGVGRRLGASLIASAIVLYIGLPLLPHWVHLWLYAVKNANPIAALMLGGSVQPVYMLWGHLENTVLLDSSVAVVLWRGGVPSAYTTDYEYHFFQPLLPGAYRLSVYVGPVRITDTIVTIPDDCRLEGYSTNNILVILQQLLSAILHGGLKGCEYDIKLAKLYVVADHVMVQVLEGNAYLASYNANGSISAIFEATSEGAKLLLCYGCGCTDAELNATIVESSWIEGCAVCKRIVLEPYAKLAVKVSNCSSGLSTSAPRGSLGEPILSLLFHDIPMAFYMIAMAYATGVWSYLLLLSLAIYGFGRILGEGGVLVIRIRY